MANKKTVIGMAALVGVLAVTAVCNFVLAGSDADSTADGQLTSANYFETYRAERTASRSEELIQLDSVIALYDEGEAKYEEATKMKMDIVENMEQELVIENMVRSLGFSDAVVSVSLESSNVNVFINAAELNYDTALSIYTMLKNETGIVAGNVIIMPVYAEN
jgi:hypothetical protein